MIDEKLLFNNILKRTDEELLQWLPNVIIRMGYQPSKLHVDSDYIFVVGDTSTLLIAHLDTKYSVRPQTMLSDKGILWSPEGIGGDGRCGVYAALEVTKRMDLGKKPSLLLVTDRQGQGKGPNGLFKFQANFPNRHPKITHAFVLNQRGYKDMVVYEPKSLAFTETVANQTGFNAFHGVNPVTHYLGLAWQIPVCALPMGYTLGAGGEYIVKKHLSNAIKQTTALLKSEQLQSECYTLEARTKERAIQLCQQCRVMLLDEEVEQGSGLCFDCLSEDY